MNKRRIYKMYPEVVRCATYQFDADDEIDYFGEYAENFKGQPLANNWRMPKYSLGASRKSLHDFVHGEVGAPIVSAHVKEALMPVAGNAVQFWPIGKLKGIEYYIFNIINILDCLDLSRSEISYSPDIPGKVLGISKAFFDYDKVPNDTVVFKVPQYPRPIYVTDIFVNCVRKYQLTGVGFEWPHDVGAAKPKNVFHDLPFRETRQTKKSRKKLEQ